MTDKELNLQSKIHFIRALVLAQSPLGVRLTQMLSWVVLWLCFWSKQVTGYAGPRASWEVPRCRPSLAIAYVLLGPPHKSHRAINTWLPHVLGLQVPSEAKPETEASCRAWGTGRSRRFRARQGQMLPLWVF